MHDLFNLYPECSWSLTRHLLFKECRRKYYYHYYAAHQGRCGEAPSELQKIYRLKYLQNGYLLLGEVCHEAAAIVIRQWAYGKRKPVVAEVIKIARNLLNQAYKQSKNKAEWWERPHKRKMLFEMYYGDELPPGLVDDIKERLPLIMENLLKSTSLKEFMEEPTSELIEVEQMRDFNVNGTKVYVKVDWIYRIGEQWVVVDWKTGQEKSEEQLKLYALYVNRIYHVPLEKIQLRTEYLLTGQCVHHEVSEQDLNSSLEKVEKSMAEMKRYLADPEQNIPQEMSSFPRTHEEEKCRWCNFREICK
jgi:hypothetical protein